MYQYTSQIYENMPLEHKDVMYKIECNRCEKVLHTTDQTITGKVNSCSQKKRN